MNGLFNPDSWMDVVAILGCALIVGIPTTIGAIAAVRGHRAAAAANEQVTNTHSTNMRDDLDGKADKADVRRLEWKLDALTSSLDAYISEDREDRRSTSRRLAAQERIADRWHPDD